MIKHGLATWRPAIGWYRFARIEPRIGQSAVGSYVFWTVQIRRERRQKKKGRHPAGKVAVGVELANGDATTGMRVPSDRGQEKGCDQYRNNAA